MQLRKTPTWCEVWFHQQYSYNLWHFAHIIIHLLCLLCSCACVFYLWYLQSFLKYEMVSHTPPPQNQLEFGTQGEYTLNSLIQMIWYYWSLHILTSLKHSQDHIHNFGRCIWLDGWTSECPCRAGFNCLWICEWGRTEKTMWAVYNNRHNICELSITIDITYVKNTKFLYFAETYWLVNVENYYVCTLCLWSYVLD